MIPEIFSHDFMLNAFAAGILVSVACGIVGTLVVVNRLSFLAGGVAHAAYGGLGLAAFLNWTPLAGTIPFALVSSFLMGAVARKNKERSDTVIGVMWAVGMAAGIILLDFKPGYYVDLMSYLFGSIITVSSSGLLMMLVLNLLIIATVTALFKEILAMSYDEEYALICGIPVKILYYVILLLIAFTVIMLIRAVGLILVIALFTIPASISELFTKDLKKMMILSSGFGMIFSITGLLLSYYLDVTAGASIILVACTGYAIALLAKKRGIKSV
ncbi:MAG: metal ABC transporter permease [Fibrobacter sp.]|nr:metal ABC transporter permease [Fibrobacter sp.]